MSIKASEARSLQKRGTQPTSGRGRNSAWLIYFQLAGRDQAARKVKSKLILLTYVCLLGFSERAVQVGHPDTVSSEREICTFLYRLWVRKKFVHMYLYQLPVIDRFVHIWTGFWWEISNLYTYEYVLASCERGICTGFPWGSDLYIFVPASCEREICTY